LHGVQGVPSSNLGAPTSSKRQIPIVAAAWATRIRMPLD